MSVDVLLPCPFCGGKAEWGHHDCANGEYHGCEACGVEVRGGPENWNRRTLAPIGQEWRGIAEAPDSDDLVWLRRGDNIDGPRAIQPDDCDYYDFFAPCEAPRWT